MATDPLQALLAAPAITRAAASQKPPAMTPEEEDQTEKTLLSKLGSGVLSGLSMAGNLLDIPASMARDVMVLDNPLNQLLDPLSHSDTGRSITGREMLDRNAITGMIIGPNKPTGISGWADDPWEGVQDVLGFGAELAMDPLAWASGALKALGSAGKVAKVATATDKAADALNPLADAAAAAAKTVAPEAAQAVRAADSAGSNLPAVIQSALPSVPTQPTAAAVPPINRFPDPLKATGVQQPTAPAKGAWGKIGRGLTKAGEVIDKYDPGFRIGQYAGEQYRTNVKFKDFIDTHARSLKTIASVPANAYAARAERLRRIRGGVPDWAGPIRQDVRDKWVSAGMPEHEVDAWMSAEDRLAQAFAKSTGQDGDQYYSQYADIRRSHPSQLQGDVLMQEPAAAVDTPEFRNWFGDSKVVDPEGKPIVVHHAGSFDELKHGVMRSPKSGIHFGTAEQAAIRQTGKSREKWQKQVEYFQDGGLWHWRHPDGTVSDGGRMSKSMATDDAQLFAQQKLAPDTSKAMPVTQAWLNITNPKRVMDAVSPKEWAKVIEDAKRQGHDGLVYRNYIEGNGEDSYVAFSPEQVKSINNRGSFDPQNPNVLFQGDPVNTAPFYSKIMDAVQAGKIPNRVGRDQLEKTLVGFGVKQEEMADLRSKFDALFSAATDGKVSKDDVFELASDNAVNGVTVTELRDRGQLPGDDLRIEASMALGEWQSHVIWDSPEALAARAHYEDLARRASELPQRPQDLPPRYEQYQVPGGIDGTYREMLIRHPSVKGFRDSNHFSEVADDVIAHARLDDVILPNGKRALRIQEIQSDLHQKGAKEGYAGDIGEMLFEVIAEKFDEWSLPDAYELVYDEVSGKPRHSDLQQYRQIAIDRLGREAGPHVWKEIERTWEMNQSGTVPDAPFKKSWHELALKSVIRKAAEEGYEYITLVKGKDIAKAIGGPPDALGKFYDDKVAGALRKMVTKYGGSSETVKTAGEPLSWSDSADDGPGAIASFVDDEQRVVIQPFEEDGRTQYSLYGESPTVARSNEPFGYFDTIDEAKRAAARRFVDTDSVSFKLTPALKATVLGKGQPLYQNARGAVQFQQDGKAVIHLFKTADFSTMVHESAHVFRRRLEEIDPELLTRAAEAVGHTGTGPWSRESEEAFSRGFESYLKTGTAPTKELRSLFYKFREWLTTIYNKLTGQDPGSVSPQLKSVFDDLMGTAMPRPESVTGSAGMDQALAAIVGGVDTARAHLGSIAADAGRQFQRQMNPLVRGTSSQIMQDASRLHSMTEQELMQSLSQPVTAIQGTIDEIVGFRASGTDDPNAIAQHALLADDVVSAIEENDFSSLPRQLIGPAQQMKVTIDEMQSRAVREGLLRPQLEDLYVDHFPHEMSPTLQAWIEATLFEPRGKSGLVSDAAVNNKFSQSMRGDLFRNGAAGRRTWNSVTADDEILNILEGDVPDIPGTEAVYDDAGELVTEATEGTNYTDADKQRIRINRAAEKIKEKYASEIDPRMPAFKGADEDIVTLRDPGTGEEIDVHVASLRDEFARLPSEFNLKTAPGRLQEHQQPIWYEPMTQAVLGSSDPIRLELVLSNKDRYQALAEWMSDKTVPLRDMGVFNRNPLVSIQKRIARDAHTIGALRALPKILQGAFREGLMTPSNGVSRGVTLDKIFSSGLFSRADRRMMYAKMADSVPELEALRDSLGAQDFPAFMDRMILDKSLADEIQQAHGLAVRGDDIFSVFSKGFRASTALFKAGVLTHPARYVRDLMSSVTALAYNNLISDTSLSSGWNAFFHKPAPELLEYPQVRAWMEKFGMDSTPENATMAAHQMYAAMKGHGQSLYRELELEDMSLAEQLQRGFTGVEAAFPGTNIRSAKQAWDQMKRAWKTGTMNPLDIAGVPHAFPTQAQRADGIERWDIRPESKFKFAKLSEWVGKNVDDFPRFVGFLEGMRQGKPAEEAFQNVTRVALDYNPRAFGPFENRWLKKIYPFYSFIRQQSVYMADELIHNPTGRLGKLIRLARHSQTDDSYLPEHVAESIAIPWGGKQEDGTQNYLTGLGLMFEDPPKLLGNNSRDTLREILGRTNPLIKGLAEWGTGRSLFQAGPMGGRDLEDMDPSLGRIFTSLGLQDPLPGGQAAPAFGSRGLEFLLSNSPVSRLLSTGRTLTDDRKGVPEKAMNTLTGLRITSVSPQVRQRGLRELSNAIAKELGSRPFTTFHVSEELLQDAANDPERLQTLLAIKELRRIWDARRKRELKAKQEADAAAAATSAATP